MPLGKGGKYKKKSGKAKHTLTQDDIEFLKKNTRYDEQEIKEWYRYVPMRCDPVQSVLKVIKYLYILNWPGSVSFGPN